MVHFMGTTDSRPDRARPAFLSHSQVQRASARIQSLSEWTLARQMELTSIPAPPFGEGPRGQRTAALFREAGLERVRVDGIGNVLGEVSAQGRNPPGLEGRDGGPLVLSAHLDTVFPPDTPVSPRREGDRVYAPGIADDGRGLAALLTLGRVLSEIPFPLPFPLLFAATVGEEGPGNLRGVRFLTEKAGESSRLPGFVSLDGVGLDRIITRGVGSTRIRITLRGPGGHSWTEFGRPNPIHLLGKAVARIQEIVLPSVPRTTLTVSKWGGGRSINAIPEDAWLEMDLRSESGEALESLEEEVRQALIREVAPTGHRRGESPPEEIWEGEDSTPGAMGRPTAEAHSDVTLQIQDIGRRPAGATSPSDPLVRAAVEATEMLGERVELIASSTDANIPMSLGIPAITLGAGGIAGGIHTLGEWYEDQKGAQGIFRALLTILLLGAPDPDPQQPSP